MKRAINWYHILLVGLSRFVGLYIKFEGFLLLIYETKGVLVGPQIKENSM